MVAGAGARRGPITSWASCGSLCALGSTMEDARTVLAEFLRDESARLHPL